MGTVTLMLRIENTDIAHLSAIRTKVNDWMASYPSAVLQQFMYQD